MTNDDPFGLAGMNRKITSHSTRKATMNDFNDSDLPFMKWSFRVGFCLRNINTMFDYVMDASRAVDANNGKCLAGWQKHNLTHHTSYLGGRPATLDVLHDAESAKKCAEHLWSNHIANGLDRRIAHILFAHVLMKTKDFIELLEQEPKGKFSGTSTPYCHPFLRKLHHTFETCSITPQKVEEWTRLITQRYLIANQSGLPRYKPAETAEYRNVQVQLDHLYELQYQTSSDVHHILLEQISIRKIVQKLLLEQEKTNNLLRNNYAIQNSGSPYYISTNAERNLDHIAKDNSPVRPTVLTSVSVDSMMWDDFIGQFNDARVSLGNKFVLYFTNDFERY